MQFKPFTYADLPELVELRPEGWSDIRNIFQFYIGADFCTPLKVVMDNRIVGLGNTVRFGNTAWLAHIIVAKDYRNRGIGYTIVTRLLKDLHARSIESVSLIATDLGEPVYRKAGFREVDNYFCFTRDDRWLETSISEYILPYRESFYPAIMKLDENISGEKREVLLKSKLQDARVYFDGKRLKGFYLPALGEGLIVADDPQAGTELMKLKYASADEAVLPSQNKAGMNFLKEHGFGEAGIKGKRMIQGKDVPWKPEGLFSRIGGNFG